MVFIAGDICAMADTWIFTVFMIISIFVWVLYKIYTKKYSPIYFTILLIFLFAYFLTNEHSKVNPISTYITDEVEGVAVQLVGTVDNIQIKDNYKQIYLKQILISLSENLNITGSAKGILVNVNESNCNVGDKIKVTGILKEFAIARNKGSFDSKMFYKTMNIEFKCNASKIEMIEQNQNEIIQNLNTFKSNLKNSFSLVANETDAGLYNSIVLGDRENLDSYISDLYKNNGITHLLAVSGLNFSIIGLSLYKILRKLGFMFLSSAIISSIIIICYGTMIGDGASVTRALIMFIISVVAGVFGRTYDVLSATSLAALFILTDSPSMLLNCGFLLSFGAILGIVIVAPTIRSIVMNEDKEKQDKEKQKQEKQDKISEKLTKKDKDADEKVTNKIIKLVFKLIQTYIFASIIISFSVNLMTLPIILYFYYQLPVYSIVINIIVVPLITLVMISALSGGILGIIYPAAGVFFIGLAHYILAFYEFICIIFSKLPYAVIVLGQPNLIQIIIYYVVLVAIILAIKYIKIGKIYSNCLYAVLVIGMVFLLSYKKWSKLEVHMIDVGQGDAIFVRTPKRETYLFDCGSSSIKNVAKYITIPWLKSNGIQQLDYIVISHMDADHMNGIKEILSEKDLFGITIEHIILPEIRPQTETYLTMIEKIKERGIPITYISAGDVFGNGLAQFECIHPSKDFPYTSENSYSATVSLRYYNFDMLFTGDLEADGENELVKNNLLKDFDVLKVAHHGSKYSSQQNFLEFIKPEFSLISCGIDNSYGHPHADLLNRLERIKSKVYTTVNCGEIMVSTDGSQITIERFLKTN